VLRSIENPSGDFSPHQSFHDHTGAIRKLLFR
jgi:hypothetical protein